MNVLYHKLKEVLSAVLPVVLIVTLLHFTIAPLSDGQFEKLLVGSVLVILGLTVFLFGIDQSIDPIGQGIGNMLSHSGKASLVIAIGLVLGFFISYAEPDLHILAGQVSQITSGKINNLILVISVSIGVAVLMTLGLMRILKNLPLKYAFSMIYGLIFLLGLFSNQNILAIAFDSSGSTTGALTTPFILSLAAGVSSMRKNSKVSEAGSFGLVGIASGGAVLGVLVGAQFLDTNNLSGIALQSLESQHGVLQSYFHILPEISFHTLTSLGPIILAYAFFEIFYFKHKGEVISNIIKGLLLTYIGLVLFLTGVNGGFMEVGRQVGTALAKLPSAFPLMLVSFILGLVTVLAEPAVLVLTHQVEDITGGSVRRPLVLIFLSIAVGVSILLATIRILMPALQLWMYILPGFFIALVLAFMIPELFVGLAFDAGGVASGPMTATFSLAFMQGIANQSPSADVLTDGFGMIAIVAMMPIIAVELLGLIYKVKTTGRRRKK